MGNPPTPGRMKIKELTRIFAPRNGAQTGRLSGAWTASHAWTSVLVNSLIRGRLMAAISSVGLKVFEVLLLHCAAFVKPLMKVVVLQPHRHPSRQRIARAGARQPVLDRDGFLQARFVVRDDIPDKSKAPPCFSSAVCNRMSTPASRSRVAVVLGGSGEWISSALYTHSRWTSAVVKPLCPRLFNSAYSGDADHSLRFDGDHHSE